MRKYKNSLPVLFDELWSGTFTQVEKPRFDVLDLIAKEIKEESILGDIVECGIWRGGCIIYLSYLFPDRIIWGLDSFQGFQKLEEAKFKYSKTERHVHDFDSKNQGSVRGGYPIAISLKDVISNLDKFGINLEDGVHLVDGFVKQTTDPSVCKIKDIALLRIDVDSYSATLETLVNLYDKVVSGGYIVFDDIPLYECQDAIAEFKKIRKINFELIGDSKQSGYSGGCYLKKK